MDCAVVVGVGLVSGGLMVVARGETLLTVGTLLAIGLYRRIHFGWIVMAVGAFVFGAVRADWAIRTHESQRNQVKTQLPVSGRCSAQALVTGSPTRARGVMRWESLLTDVVCEGEPRLWHGKTVLYGGDDDLRRGDQLEVTAQLAMPQRFWNQPTEDPRPGDARRGALRSGSVVAVDRIRQGTGVLAAIDWARCHVRRRIDATFPSDVAPMARALVLGENDLTSEDERAFNASGLSHLLAVSGMHLVLVVVGVVEVLRGLLVRIETLAASCDTGRLASCVGLPIAWGYAVFAGGSGSAIRAAWMLSAAFAARAIGRRGSGPRSLGLSALGMALSDPLVVFDRSFVLSVAATAGLMFASSPIARFLGRWLPTWMPIVVLRSIASSIAASVACFPVLALFAPTLSFAGVVANLVAVPIGEMAALPLCLSHAVLSFWPSAERGCALLASGALWLVRAIARTFASTPLMSMNVPAPTGWQISVITVAVGAVSTLRGAFQVLAVILASTALVILEIGARREGRPEGILRVTVLDVGQGDASLVDLPDGTALLIDGGGLVGSPVDVGVRVIAPVLRARRRSRLAAVIVSHPHPDHYLGLMSGLAATSIGSLWDTGQAEGEGEGGIFAQLLDTMRQRGVPILRPESLCGSWLVGGATIDVISPCPAPSSDHGANDNSFVVRIAFGRRSMLFVGDAEGYQEAALTHGSRNFLRADVLKVGHHGSRTSTGADFLAAVQPSEAIVSVGGRNRFGHPHTVTLDRLNVRGVHLWRTDENGSVTVWSDGDLLRVDAAHATPSTNAR